MAETEYGQTGLWNETDLGPLQEPQPRQRSTRVRPLRRWAAHRSEQAAEAASEQAQNSDSRPVQGSTAPYLDLDLTRAATAPTRPPAAQTDWSRDGSWPDGVVALTLLEARQIKVGDVIWYQGREHAVRLVDLRGGFDFRQCGVAPPYYGLAGITSTVTRGGKQNVHGRLTENGVVPALLYTDLDGERIGWVSYLQCRFERQEERSEQPNYQQRVWWARPRKLSTF